MADVWSHRRVGNRARVLLIGVVAAMLAAGLVVVIRFGGGSPAGVV